ncbi:hypothetical protein [Streptococcus loxodontisalivarius]|uniref:Uncharacterized protein n=1 Tax=Streptococcus loxodontisalivarius TaxID=1349415 RepID=A0ABS2PTM9_9STRE|nr:hypothetical protein [Streptococcus loxodontisalivarius]MBM7643389.1 hypothetical protein [Streptococcus loxodontisalivarius]
MNLVSLIRPEPLAVGMIGLVTSTKVDVAVDPFKADVKVKVSPTFQPAETVIVQVPSEPTVTVLLESQSAIELLARLFVER